MNKTRIAASLIVKNDEEVGVLKRCLDSIAPYVDGIYLTVTQKPFDSIVKLCQQYGVNVDVRPSEFNYVTSKEEPLWLKKFLGYKPTLKEGDVIFKFSEARNANLSFIPDDYDWLFWIDADDVLLNPQNLHPTADDAMQRGTEAVFLNYLYQVELDEQGKIKNVIIQHLRERLVRIRGEYRKVYKWIGNIHETLIQQRETKKDEYQTMEVLHLSTGDRMSSALQRNMRVLEHDIYATQGKDPRPIYYLAKALYDLHTDESYERAKKLMLIYLSPEGHQNNMSGWKEERAQAWEYLAEIYRAQGQHNNSIKALHNALIEYPEFRSTYLSLAISHMVKDEPDTARFWAILASKIPPSRTTLVSNPRDLESRLYEVIYNAAIKTNRVDEAWAACEKLKELYPNDPGINQQWAFINETREVRNQLKNYAEIINFLNKTGQNDKLRALVASAPNQVATNPYLIKLQQQLTPAKDWTDKEVAIYCGQQFTQWDPTSLENKGNSFVGGSEEAVIYLAKALADLGWKPVVYADPVKEGVYDGVEYLAYYKFNTADNFNILIYWRAISWVDMNCKAKKTFLWAHDVQNPVEYTKERLDKVDKIFVLSEAHRQTIKDVPLDKIVISSNGYFEHHPEIKPENNPKWCIYTSSYDRGLENLLKVWPDVVKEVPDAQLHVFYGWKLFSHFYRGNPERMSWMRKMQELLKQPGVTDHDNVQQPELERWYKKCGLFAYPSHFYEINCISAIKAQLWGAVPVTTDFAALKETVRFGKKVEGEVYENFALSPELSESYKNELVKALKDDKWQEEQRRLSMPWAREKYGWNKIAKEWTEVFNGS